MTFERFVGLGGYVSWLSSRLRDKVGRRGRGFVVAAGTEPADRGMGDMMETMNLDHVREMREVYQIRS